MRTRAFALPLVIMFTLSLVFGRLGFVANGNSAIFTDGFESGDFSKWTETSSGGAGTVTVANPIKHSGTYAARTYCPNNDNDFCSFDKDISTSATTTFVRWYVYIASSPSSGAVLYSLSHTIGVGGWQAWNLYIEGTTRALRLNYNTNLDDFPSKTSATTLSLSTWYSIEVKWVRDANAGEYRVYLNGSEVADLTTTGLATNNMGALSNTQFGPTGGRYYSSTVDIYFDDVVVDSSYIGPGLLDKIPPTYGSISTNTSIAGAPCNFDSLISDDTNVSTYIFSTNNTGTWTNDTAIAFSNFYNSTTAWANVTKTLNDTAGNTVSYLWFANDTSNNWSSSNQNNLTLTAPYTPTLQLTPTNQTCRKYGETFTLNMTISDPVDVTSLEFEIHYNATLLNCSSITWTAWGSGSITVDQTNGVINGSTSGTPLNDNQTLIGVQFTATYHHIWKVISGWTNDVSDTIFIQSANLTSATKPDLTYIRGTINQINIGPDVTYTFSPIRGDVDNNGQVDVLDLRTVAIYYDQPNDTYNLVGDPTIDIYDLVVVASNLGYKY